MFLKSAVFRGNWVSGANGVCHMPQSTACKCPTSTFSFESYSLKRNAVLLYKLNLGETCQIGITVKDIYIISECVCLLRYPSET
jgi:hypothetical protein